ncbi:MAG: ADP-ribosylglycohydrolase family protein [Propionibacteriaceae bacterium]|jgi:ADP-ribosylglycohydrolase|nr:ADP-ribosylglycohydrolase family protein [Propionibacteriaceae bacterium]
MLGAIIGDIVGSPYEFDRGTKSVNFPLFAADANYTDDTLLTLALGQAMMDAAGDETIADELIVRTMREFAARYPLPKGGFGGRFTQWLLSKNPQPYGSFGNGSAMRVSSVGWLYDTLETTEHWAKISARVTHNHPEGIKGAQATAAAIFLARTEGATSHTKIRHRNYLAERFGYDLSRSCDEIRVRHHHQETCQLSVPAALSAYFESTDFENALRLVISLGGDTDTEAAITGAIAAAAYGIPEPIIIKGRSYLPPDLLAVLDRFSAFVEA